MAVTHSPRTGKFTHQCPFPAPQVSYPCPASCACAAPARSSPACPAFRPCPDPQVQPRSQQVQSRGGEGRGVGEGVPQGCFWNSVSLRTQCLKGRVHSSSFWEDAGCTGSALHMLIHFLDPRALAGPGTQGRNKVQWLISWRCLTLGTQGQLSAFVLWVPRQGRG